MVRGLSELARVTADLGSRPAGTAELEARLTRVANTLNATKLAIAPQGTSS